MILLCKYYTLLYKELCRIWYPLEVVVEPAPHDTKGQCRLYSCFNCCLAHQNRNMRKFNYEGESVTYFLTNYQVADGTSLHGTNGKEEFLN